MNVIHLGSHRFRTVIPPEFATTPYGTGNRLFKIMQVGACQSFDRSIADRIRRAGRRLVQPMIYAFHSGPAFAIKRHAENNLLSWHSGGKKTLNCIIAIAFVEWRRGRIVRIMKERAVQVCERLIGPVLVVGHDGKNIQIDADLLQLKLFVQLSFGGKRCGQKQARSGCVQLAAKFCQHCCEVFDVFRTSGTTAAYHRIFPININAIKNSWSFNAGRKVSLDEGVNAGPHELTHMFRARSAGETAGLVPSAKGDNDLQFREASLQFLELMKCSSKLPRTRWIYSSIYAVRFVISMVQRSFTVGNLAAIIGNAPKRIIQFGEPGRCSAVCDIFYRIVAGSRSTFSEIPNHLGFSERSRLCRDSHRPKNQAQENCYPARHAETVYRKNVVEGQAARSSVRRTRVVIRRNFSSA